VNENWDFYDTLVDGRPAWIFTDLALAQLAPVASLPVLGHVSVTLRTPRADGLSGSEEFDDLIALEHAIEAAVTAQCDAIYVGRCTTGGRRDFHFYIADPQAFIAAAERALREHPGYGFAAGYRDDPEWTVYREFLHPAPRDLQRIHNRRVLSVLEERGDDFAAPRLIDHCAYLPDRAAAETLRVALLAEGFSVTLDANEGEALVTVDFKRLDPPEAIDAVAMALFDRIAALGGTYDGWGCEVESTPL